MLTRPQDMNGPPSANNMATSTTRTSTRIKLTKDDNYNLRKSSIVRRVQSEKKRNSPKQPKPKSRPAPLSKYRRKTANNRERERMKDMNDAFEELRNAVPVVGEPDPKQTKVTTLKHAMDYITALRRVLGYQPGQYDSDGVSLSIGSDISSSTSDCSSPRSDLSSPGYESSSPGTVPMSQESVSFPLINPGFSLSDTNSVYQKSADISGTKLDNLLPKSDSFLPRKDKTFPVVDSWSRVLVSSSMKVDISPRDHVLPQCDPLNSDGESSSPSMCGLSSSEEESPPCGLDLMSSFNLEEDLCLDFDLDETLML